MNRNSARITANGRAPRASARRLHAQPLGALTARVVLALGVGGLVLADAGVASAQALGGQFPFPSTNVAAGVTTGALTSHELRQLYLDWREALVEQCPQGDARVRYPETNNDTRSEGIGYGMVISAYMGDQQTFDGLWGYYQRTSTNGLMNWKRFGCDGTGGGGDNGSAADADIDAALALIVADRQFPGNGYGADATQILGAIRTQLFDGACQGVLLAGTQFRGCDCINPSYIPPAYYVAYATVDQAAFWTQARDASYTYLNAASNDATGLVPAWSQNNGNLDLGPQCTPEVSGGGATSAYQADAARTPWRVATDYLWTGEPRAEAFLQSIGGFAASQQLMRIRDSYTLQGQPANGNALASHELGRNTYVMGGFATAMLAVGQTQLDDFTGAWISVYKSGDNYDGTFRAFNNSLALLYGLVVTGAMWNPVGADPTPIPESPLTPASPGNLVINGDFEEGVTGWAAFSDFYDYDGNQMFTSSDGFALHQAGEMRLRVVSNEPAEPQRLSLRQTVSLNAGQRYRLAVDARAAAPRPFSASVGQGDTTFGRIATGPDGATLSVDTEMRTFQTVFEMAAAAEAELVFEFGHSSEDVTIDNVILETTELPLDPGSTVGGPPPAPVPGAPGAPAPGAGAPAPGDGSLGAVGDLGADVTGAPLTPGAPAAPGGLTPAGTPSATPGNPSVPSAQNCAPAAYSAELNLCYDLTTGYVWDTAQGTWTLPPQVEWCGADERSPGNFNYWWPLLPACYSPVSGYAWNDTLRSWVFVGVDFTRGEGVGSDDSAGCAVSGARTTSNGWTGLALLGLVGAAMTVRRRR